MGETFDLLRQFHRSAPSLFFNGNTFASIGRELSLVIFNDLPPIRKKTVSSAVAHYVAGVLERDSMVNMVEGLWRVAQLQMGDRVRTLKGSLHGEITTVLDDGRVAWRPDGATSELMALPESLENEKS